MSFTDLGQRNDVVIQGEEALSPLQWWLENEEKIPMLASIARIVLECPGSQIECERIFSLFGLTVSLLRNRMSTSHQTVYISKNTDQLEVLLDIMGERNGNVQAESYFHFKTCPVGRTCSRTYMSRKLARP